MEIYSTFKYLKITAMDEPLSMDQVFIRKITEIVLANLSDEEFNVEKLTKAAGLSSSTVHRRLRVIAHKSVSQFIREIRLQRGMEMLKNNVGTVSEVAYKVGFGSPTYFNKCFHGFYGYPPGEVRKRESEKALESIKSELEKSHESDHSFKRGFTKISIGKNSSLRNLLLTSTLIISGILLTLFFYKSFIKRPDDIRPMRNANPGNTDAYFTNGTMETNLNNLQVNKNLSVNSITSDQDSNLIMFDTFIVTLRPGVTMGQYVDFLKTKLVSEYCKNFPGSILTIVCRDTWLKANRYAFIYDFKSLKVYNRYYPNGLEMSDECKAAWEKTRQSIKEEESKYIINKERDPISEPEINLPPWFNKVLDSLSKI